MRLDTPLPLASLPKLESDSFDEFEAAYASHAFPIRVDRPRRDRAFRWRSHFVDLGDLSLSSYELATSLRVSSDNAAEIVVLSIPIGCAPAETWLGQKGFELVPRRLGFIVPPSIPGRVAVGAGFRALNVIFKQQALDHALVELTGKCARSRLMLRPVFPLDSHGAGAFLRILNGIVTELEDPQIAPRALERLGDALIFQLLHVQPHNHSALLSVRVAPDEPEQVRRVAEYLETCVTRTVRMSELTALTGTTVRSIQAGFEKHRGCSPMEFLRARRLDRARAMLLARDARSINDVARACGFTHAGRFSASYRARFGETPTRTRARSSAS